MNKKVLLGGAVSALLLIVLVVGVATVDWDDYTTSDVPNEVPVFPTDDQDSIWDDSGAYGILECLTCSYSSGKLFPLPSQNLLLMLLL